MLFQACFIVSCFSWLGLCVIFIRQYCDGYILLYIVILWLLTSHWMDPAELCPRAGVRVCVYVFTFNPGQAWYWLYIVCFAWPTGLQRCRPTILCFPLATLIHHSRKHDTVCSKTSRGTSYGRGNQWREWFVRALPALLCLAPVSGWCHRCYLAHDSCLHRPPHNMAFLSNSRCEKRTNHGLHELH